MKTLFLSITLLATSHAFAQLDSLLAIADTIQTDEKRVDWYVLTGYDFYTIDPVVSEELASMGLKLSQEIGYTFGIARSHHILGIAYWTTGLYEKALEHNLKAQSIYEELDKRRWIKIIKMNNANIYGALERFDEAINVLKSVINQAEMESDSQLLMWMYNNLGTDYRRIGQYDSAIFYLEKDLPYAEALGDTVGVALIHNNIAVALESLDRNEEAITHLKIARAQLRLKSSEKRLAEIYTNFASNYGELENFKLHKTYLDSALAVAEKINGKRIIQEVYLGYSDYYYKKQDYKNSLDFFEKSTMIKDSISSAEIKKETAILELKYNYEKKQKQIAVLEKEGAENELRIRTMTLTGVLVFLLLAVFILFQRLKINKSRAIQNQLNAELEHKNKELTSYALNFIQKNELMNELTDKISELKKQSDTKAIKELNQMNGIINNSFRVDQDWENFKVMFEEIHGDFFFRLKTSCPDLGNAELRLCALLRLNMNLKESSKILGISSDSVKTARYRLRKKLGLQTEDNLIDWLIRFDTGTRQAMSA